VTLNLRLLINMFADHLVSTFTDLPRSSCRCFHLLGALVSVIQAAVFTMLSMVYVALAVGGHDEDAQGEHQHH
jgi:F0F1-type ATP synthase membrane subunit a